jgi:teichuronic acid biosynthesis glycosyltransferase TuaG
MFVDGLVSVIIPVYNSERYIKETIESVLKQTYKKIEIVIVDDCSMDMTEKIIKDLQKEFNNIIYFRQETNYGAAVARNKAISIARGRYIAFLDSDDLWMSRKIQMQLDFMKNMNNSIFSYTNYSIVNEIGNLMKSKIVILPIVTYKDLLTNTVIATSTVILDRNFIKDIEMPLRRTGQDYAFWLKLLRNNNAYGIDEHLVKIRKRSNSLSKNKLQNIKDVWEIQRQFEQIPSIKVLRNVMLYSKNAIMKRI